MATTVDDRLQPKKGNAFIGTKLEDLWLQIQVYNGKSEPGNGNEYRATANGQRVVGNGNA